MFRVPDSDDSIAPSTPDRSLYRFAGPSTTPAGPPPHLSFAAVSSTPAGAPPTDRLFGGQRPNLAPQPSDFDHLLFGSSPPKSNVLEGNDLGHPRTTLGDRPETQRGRTANSGLSRFLQDPGNTHGAEQGGYGNTYQEDDAEGEYDDDMGELAEYGRPTTQRPRMQDSLSQSWLSQYSADEYRSAQSRIRSGMKQQQYNLLDLARGLAPSSGRVNLRESGDIILGTERIVERLHSAVEGDALASKSGALRDATQELLALWQASSSQHLSTASRLAALLLGIHHPGRIVPEERNLSASRALIQPGAEPSTPIPRVLLDWINIVRSPDDDISGVLDQAGGYSRNVYFWDMVHVSALYGRFTTTMKLLSGADFSVACTASEDDGVSGSQVSGYTGPKLGYANHATEEVLILLRQCPALLDDWDISGHDWTIFRQRVAQAKRDLVDFAEGESQSRHTMSQSLGGSHFGLSQSYPNFSLTTHSRKVECKVPWTIYENLLKLYDILVGDEEQMLNTTDDWIESTIMLTIWWNGEEDDLDQESLMASRRSLTRAPRANSVDAKAYSRRLAAAFALVSDSEDESYVIKTTDPFEVGTACIFDDNVEGALHIMRSLSLVAASAVAEVASAGEWYKRDGVFGELDQSDLLLLSYTQPSRTDLSKDDLLASYAEQLSLKEQVSQQDGSESRAGWELAIEVLGRLDDTGLANQRIQQILDGLPLTSAEEADKVIRLCHTIGLSDQALGIALKFADQLQTSTQNYGDAVLYYARAHAADKIQEVLRTLVAHCLVKSVAYPPLSELDASLKKLVTSPKKTLTELAAQDAEAAELLSKSLSGYATIRKFYDLRDEEVLLKDGETPEHRPMTRKRIAANALMVVISSAADSIRGGLYDPEVETVVPVDVLLPLLGEALLFVNQPKRTLTLRHLYDLLAAVEDLSTAPSMIQAQCEEALRTTFAAAHENNPRLNLNKSTSNLTTASSQYSLIGSMDLGSVEGVSTESSTVLVKGGGVDDVKRGWDWRKGFPRGATGEDVIRVLRLEIAKELGRAFAEGEITP